MIIRIVLLAVFLFAGSVSSAFAATYTVNSPLNDDDGSCVHPFVDASNDCTLHEAIDAANSNGGADTIVFSIDSSFDGNPTYTDGTQYVIPISTVLPSITGQTTITAAANYDSGNDIPGIKLTSSSSSFDTFTFASGSSSSRVSGIEVDGFRRAVYISVGSTITIGTDCDGSSDASERNVIYGGANNAIRIDTGSNIIAGNYLGVQNNGSSIDATGFATLTLNTANADDNAIGFREGQSCTAAQQRNVIAGTTSFATAVAINGTGTANGSGDASLGPDSNEFKGNYIGVAADGISDLSGSGTGGALSMITNSTLNIIGTDGDGVGDTSEGNIIYGNGSVILLSGTGTNRVSGNYIGVDSTGNATIGEDMSVGYISTGDENIFGWCDTTVHATLCSDSGAGNTQRNVVGGATSHGMRFGSDAENNVAYGNYFGVGANGVADVGNTDVGVFVHRNSSNNIAGGSSNKANTIQHNGVGVMVDGDFTGTEGSGQTAITDTTITGNTISENDTVGVQFYYALNYASGAQNNVLSDNTISENGTIGVEVLGSSPSITGNTISDNGTYGVKIHPGFVTYDGSDEIIVSADPDTASEDLVSAPTLTTNTISGNSSGGILQLDTTASNDGTLFSGNTFADNNSQPAILQQWYAAVEVLDNSEDPLDSSLWSGTNVTLTPNGSAGSALTSAASDAEGSDDVVFGPSSVDYDDATTWFAATEYTVNTAGTQISYNDYVVSVDGTYNTDSGSWSIDGTDNDTTYTGTLANGISSGGHQRYQIVHVPTSTTPATPTNTSPTNGTTVSTLQPTLTTSSFSDDGETHASTEWNVHASSSACSTGGTGSVYSTTSTTAKTSLTVPSGRLSQNTTYYWRAAHTNSFGNSSTASSCTSFTTIKTTPSIVQAIPAQTWDEDTSLTTTVDLDDYFSDAEGETLFYSGSSSEENITVTVGTGNILALSSAENWNGTATATVTACDTDSECVTSAAFRVTVTAVNDTPTAPSSGFSPKKGDVISKTTPTISWNAGTDQEDAASGLQYTVRLSPSAEFVNADTQTSTVGTASLTWDTALEDDTTYYYAVRTVDSAGATSSWSATQQFSVNSSVAPVVSLTKEFVVLDSDLGTNAIARTATESTGLSIGSIQSASAIGFGASIALLSGAMLLALSMVGRPVALWAAATFRPALAFALATVQAKGGTYGASYTSFRRRLVPIGASLQLSTFAAVIFLGATVVTTVSFGEEQSTVLAPGDTLLVTIEYENTGDGSATNAVLADTLSSDTVLSTQSIAASHAGDTKDITVDNTTAQMNIGSIAPGESGTLQYTVALRNPVGSDAVTFPSAVLSASEFEVNAQPSSDWATFAIQSGAVIINVQNTSGNVIENVPVTLSSNGQQRAEITSNTDGNSQFERFKAGAYAVNVASDSGYTSVGSTAQIVYGETTGATLVVERLAGGVGEEPTPEEEANEEPGSEEVNENEQEKDDTPPVLEDDTTASEEEQTIIEEQPPLTEEAVVFTENEQRQLQNDLEEAVQAIVEQISIEVDDIVDSVHDLQEERIVLRRPRNCSLRARYLPWFDNADEEAELVFEGNIDIDTAIREKLAEVNAPVRIRVTILSDPLIQIAQVDENGTWRMEFPLEALIGEEHTVFAEAGANGQSSGVVEVVSFSVEDENCTSYTIIVLIIDIVVLGVIVVLLRIARRRYRKRMHSEEADDQEE